MNDNDLSLQETKRLIERALLPDRCVCDVAAGVLTLTLVSEADASHVIKLTGIKVEGLNSSRAVAYVIGEARYMLAQLIKGSKHPVYKPTRPLKHAG